MKICFITKYPPIQGGVSASCYWAARGLAEKGHNVFVVTNANEVEPRYKMFLKKDDLGIEGEYAKSFPETGGSVSVYSTNPPPEEIFYIPQNNPTVSRLATISTDIILREKCEVIFASYLEPYCVAAQLASFWTNTPFIVKHAGSDLYRLFENEELMTGYSNILKNANRIISGGVSTEKLKSIGVNSNRIVENIAFTAPKKFFCPTESQSSINDLIEQNIEINNKSEYEKCYSPIDDNSLPVLGVYGKLGRYKGTLDLLYAMSKLINEGFPFYLVTMSNPTQYIQFLDKIKELNLINYLKFIPFLPHWKVPMFIHSCNAVAFLERDFPIKAHSPIIPSEILNCGTCLVMSEEIAFKQHSRNQFRNFRNVVILPDPKDHESLAKVIRFTLEDKARSRIIGERGNKELTTKRRYEDYIEKLESLLISVASEKPLFLEKQKSNESLEILSIKKTAEMLFPMTCLMLENDQIELLNNHFTKSGIDRLENFDKYVLSGLISDFDSIIETKDKTGIEISKEVFRYEVDMFMWNKRRLLAQTKDKENVLSRPIVSSENLDSLIPCIYGVVEINDYSYDVTKIVETSTLEEQFGNVKNSVKILFPTYSQPRKINQFTQNLLKLVAKNSRNCGEIFEVLCGSLKSLDEDSIKKFKKDYLVTLETLYWLEIIKFSEK